MSKKVTTEDFIKRAKGVHGDKYDYSKTIYVNNRTKVYIICSEHGKFYQTPSAHLSGSGCKKCGYKTCGRIGCKIPQQRSTKYEFVIKATKIHNTKYDYSKTEYINSRTKVCIICPDHGAFWQRPNDHLKGRGCKQCGDAQQSISHTLTHNEFIVKANNIHNNKYEYSKSKYQNAHTKIRITCPEHGDFLQSPASHLSKHGCPICKSSKGEIAVAKFLDDNNIKYIREYRFPDCKDKRPLPFDFYIPKLDMLIEYDGIQHFKPIDKFGGINTFNNVQYRDSLKSDYAELNNIQLIRIPYTEIDNTNKILQIFF